MKAMLMAAGRGERMRPLTDHTAKPLLQANDKRLIEYHLEKLPTAGITDVVINTCWHGAQIIDCLGDGARYGLSITYSEESTALETAGGVANALPQLGSEPFLLISADVWCDIDFQHIPSLPEEALARLVLVANPAHHRGGDFQLHGELVTVSGHQPTCTYSGISLVHPDLFTPALGKAMPLREVLAPAIKQQRVCGYFHTGMWMDVGTPERLAELDAYLSGRT